MTVPVVWAFDPGDHTGWAEYIDGELKAFGQCEGLKDLLKMMKTMKDPDVIVIEDYKVMPHVNHNFSRVNTIQVIGALKAKAVEYEAKMVLQAPSIKPIAYKWAGIEKPKNHAMSHETDAIVHGYYWLVKERFRKPALIEKSEKSA